MKKILFAFAGIILFGNPAFSQGFFKLCWYDEFDSTALDQTKWGYQTGTGEGDLVDWGNNEQQYYMAENAAVKDGLLVITAKKEQKGNKPYTSARLLTRGKFSTTFGRIEARISLPKTDGMWPAFWMLPQNSPYGGWASSGEIDIMEAKGRLPDKYSGAIHYGGEWPGNVYFTTGDYVFPNNKTIEDFHVYALEWKENEIAWYCDGHLVGKQTQWSSEKAPYPAPFDVDFYILLNLAVGGNFDNGVTPPAGFASAEMIVDYVRVYKWDEKLTEPELPPPGGNKEVETPEITISQSENSLFIHSTQAIKTAGLYSINGQLYVRVDNTDTIDTSNIQNGIYVLEVEDVQGASRKFKIIIRKS